MNAQLMLARHAHDQLVGRMTRRLADAVAELDVGLVALRNKTPRVEVAIERTEVTLDALRAKLLRLRPDDRDLAGEATEREAYVQRLRADITPEEAAEELAELEDQRWMLDQEQPD